MHTFMYPSLKYMTSFRYNKVTYKFKSLLFGLSTSAKVFTSEHNWVRTMKTWNKNQHVHVPRRLARDGPVVPKHMGGNKNATAADDESGVHRQ